MFRAVWGHRLAPFLTCLLAAGGQADDGVEGEEMAFSRPLETVVVSATRREATILDATEAVAAVEADEITRLAPEMLAAMLRGVPGVFFQQTTPGQGVPIIRGVKGSQVLHLVDGMRLNNAFFRNAPNQYLGLVDAYATERAEVLRGPAPSLYGADAMGGVLQVLSREPEFRSPDWNSSGRLYGSYHSADSAFIGRAEAAAGRSGHVWSGGVTFQDHGDRRTGSGDTVSPSGYEVRAADLKWRHELRAGMEIMLSAQYLEQPSSPRVDELLPGYGQDLPSSAQYWFEPNRREFLHARLRYDGTSRWFQHFEAHIARQRITDDRRTQDFGSSRLTREANESRLDGATFQFNSPWGPGGAHELTWGFETYSDEIRSQRQVSDAATGASQPARGRFPDRSSMDSAAIYGYNRWQWGRFALSAGLRYSVFEVFLPASGEIGAVRLEPSDLTGDLHLNYEARPGIHLVANAGRGFRPPNIFDLGTLGSRPGNRFNVPNPDLGPESVWSYDAGVKASSGRWQLEIYAWYAAYRDKIASRFTGRMTPEGRFEVRSDNLNSATLYGLESGLRFLAGEHLEWYAVVNHTRGTEQDQGLSVPADRVPPLNGRLGLVYRPTAQLRFETYLDFASRQDRLSPRDAEDPRIDPRGTPGHGTLNLLFSWRPGPALELGLRLQNLGDKAYREHGSGIDAPGRNLGAWFDFRF